MKNVKHKNCLHKTLLKLGLTSEQYSESGLKRVEPL